MLLGPPHCHLILHHCLTPARRPPSSPPPPLFAVFRVSFSFRHRRRRFHRASDLCHNASLVPSSTAPAPCEFVPCSLARNRNVTAAEEQESRRSSGIGRSPAAVGVGDSHARALRHTGVGCRDFLRLLQLQLQVHDSIQPSNK